MNIFLSFYKWYSEVEGRTLPENAFCPHLTTMHMNDNSPTTLLPGGAARVNLTVKNTSNFTWNATASGSIQPVQVFYRWVSAQGQTVATSRPITLTQNVNVGTSLSIVTTLQAPLQFGTYTVQWDMQQGSTIFSQQGAQVRSDSVRIVPMSRQGAPSPGLRSV